MPPEGGISRGCWLARPRGARIDDATMRSLNYEVDGKKRDVAEVVKAFLSGSGAGGKP